MIKEDYVSEFFNVPASKITIYSAENYSKFHAESVIFIEKGKLTGKVFTFRPMYHFTIDDGSAQSNLYLSNNKSFILASMLSEIVKPITTQIYFMKSPVCKYWEVKSAYKNVKIWNRQLTEKIRVEIQPNVDSRKRRGYKFFLVDETNVSKSFFMTYGEIEMLLEHLKGFIQSNPMYHEMFENRVFRDSIQKEVSTMLDFKNNLYHLSNKVEELKCEMSNISNTVSKELQTGMGIMMASLTQLMSGITLPIKSNAYISEEEKEADVSETNDAMLQINGIEKDVAVIDNNENELNEESYVSDNNTDIFNNEEQELYVAEEDMELVDSGDKDIQIDEGIEVNNEHPEGLKNYCGDLFVSPKPDLTPTDEKEEVVEETDDEETCDELEEEEVVENEFGEKKSIKEWKTNPYVDLEKKKISHVNENFFFQILSKKSNGKNLMYDDVFNIKFINSMYKIWEEIPCMERPFGDLSDIAKDIPLESIFKKCDHKLHDKTKILRGDYSIMSYLINSDKYTSKNLPAILFNAGRLGTPGTSLIHTAALLAEGYSIIDELNEKHIDLSSKDTIAKKNAVLDNLVEQMFKSDFTSLHPSTTNQYIRYFKCLSKSILKSSDNINEKMVSINDIILKGNYDYSYIDVNVEDLDDKEKKYLLKALMDCYFLAWYADGDHIPPYSESLLKNVEYYSLVNIKLAEFIRCFTINYMLKMDEEFGKAEFKKYLDDNIIPQMCYFKRYINFYKWEEEIYFDAFKSFFAYYKTVCKYSIKNAEKYEDGIYYVKTESGDYIEIFDQLPIDIYLNSLGLKV